MPPACRTGPVRACRSARRPSHGPACFIVGVDGSKIEAMVTGDPFEAVRRGDPAAFTALFRRTQPLLLRYLRVIAGDDAEDIASDTWLAVVRDIRTFHGDESAFRAWLLTVARHRLVDARRAQARRPADPTDAVPEPGATGAPDAAESALESMATQRAVRLIAALAPDQAEAVYLRFVAGLDVASVARLMDRTPGAVRVLTHRGLARLADRLSDDGV